jgi:hypothetical protein
MPTVFKSFADDGRTRTFRNRPDADADARWYANTARVGVAVVALRNGERVGDWGFDPEGADAMTMTYPATIAEADDAAADAPAYPQTGVQRVYVRAINLAWSQPEQPRTLADIMDWARARWGEPVEEALWYASSHHFWHRTQA